MDEQDSRQHVSDLGDRFLRRALDDLVQLRQLLAQARSEAVQPLQEIGRLAHRIRGSGAMFGFGKVSERARQLELLAGHRIADSQTTRRLEECIRLLEEEVCAAARARAILSSDPRP